MPGRRQKPVELKALEGTLRKDRDPDPEDVRALMLPLLAVEAPSSIRDKKTREAWNMALEPLCASGRVSKEDVPTLELAHLALRDVYIFQKRLVRLQRAKDWELNKELIAQVGQLARLVSRRAADYIKIMEKFGVTPIERARLLSGAGGAKKQSLVSRLLED